MHVVDDRFHYGVEEHAFYKDQVYYTSDHFLTEDALTAYRQEVDAMLSRTIFDFSSKPLLPWPSTTSIA